MQSLNTALRTNKFEIIEECDITALNNIERKWQEYYNVLDKKGLNCEYVKTEFIKGVMSNETKNKLSKSLTGRKLSKSHVEKIKVALSKRIVSNNVKIKIGNLYRGKKLSKEHVEKMRKTKLSQNLKSSWRKKIKQFDKNNIFIKEFDCITNCANELNLHRSNIIKVLKGTRKTTGGFIFKYSAVE